MSSSDEDVPLEKRKKSHSDRLKKRVKNGKSSKNRDDEDGQLEKIALTALDLVKKYKNISRTDLEELCERLLIYDQTGLYIPPGEFNANCQVKKNKHRPPKHRTENVKPAKEKFGKGQIGVGHGQFGCKVCPCCNGLNPEHVLQIPSGEVRVEPMSHVDQATGVVPKREPSPDLNLPGCSGMNNFQDFLSSDDIMEFVKYWNNNEESDIDSLNEPSTSNSFDPNLLSDSLQVLSEMQLPTPEVIDLATGPYNFRNRPATSDQEVVVVDLTNVTPVTDRRLRNSNLEVIELLDDSNSVPTEIETIDLVDSDSEDEKARTVSDLSLLSKMVDGKPVFECPVCLESLKNKKVMSTTCGHIFCSSCSKNIMKITKSCPNCRKKLRASNIHPLYFNF